MTIYPIKDELIERYFTLANTQIISNMARYALEWDMLAADARKQGRIASAAHWQARANHYKSQAGGEYIRLIEGSFSQLIRIDQSELITEG